MTTFGTTFQQRVFAIFLLFAVVWVGWANLLGPIVFDVMTYHGEYRESQHKLQQYRRIAAGAGAITAELSKVEVSEIDKLFFRNAPTNAVAAASMQNQIRGAIEKHGGKIQSIQNKKNLNDAPTHQVHLAISLSSDMSAITAILHEIESIKPFLIIHKTIISHRSGSRHPGTAQKNPDLNTRIEVIGFVTPKRGEFDAS